MFRNAVLISLFSMIGSTTLLYGGGNVSSPVKEGSANEKPSNSEKNIKPLNLYDYQQELHTYLEELKVDNIKTKLELRQYLQNEVNKGVYQTNKLPLFRAFIEKTESKRDEKQERELQAALTETMDTFVNAKKLP